MKNKTIKNIVLLISLIGLPVLVLALEYLPSSPVQSLWDIERILTTIVNWIFTILMIVAVIYILLAAFAYLGSAGDPEKVKTAQNRLIYAAVAIGVGLIAQGVRFVVSNLLRT
jgi:phosphoglycerol transferase MdoB-like AlkP superfamily enzyme